MMEYIILALILVISVGLVWLFAWPKTKETPKSVPPIAPYKLDIDLFSELSDSKPKFDPDATPVPPISRKLLRDPDITTPTIKFKPTSKKITRGSKKSGSWKLTARAHPRKPKGLT